MSSLPVRPASEIYSADVSLRFEQLRTQLSGSSPRYFTAPGRSEIGGNHTDHQQGCVLACAVSLDAIAAAIPTDDQIVRVRSEGYPDTEVDLTQLSPVESERGTSASLIRGIAARFAELGYRIGGFEAAVSSQVPGGSGLSSSAAYEVLIGAIFDGLFNQHRISPEELAQIGQWAENLFFGKPCGLMDQTASAMGGVTAIDFYDPSAPIIRPLAVDFAQYGYSLCIIDTGGSHVDLTADYAAIPSEMGQVAALLGATHLRYVTREALLDAIPRIRPQVGDRAILRALHFLADNERAQKEASLLAAGHFDAFLAEIRASGQSSWMYLQNLYPSGSTFEQPAALALAYCESILKEHGACRIHGGGFAGTIQAFVPTKECPNFVTQMEALTGPGSCRVLSVRLTGAAEVIL